MADRFQGIFDNLREKVVVLDQSLRITYANPAWMRHVGLSPSQVIGHSCHQVSLAAKDPCPLEACAAQQVFKTGQPVLLDRQGHSPPGCQPGDQLSTSPMIDSLGQVTQVVQILYPSPNDAPPLRTPATSQTEQMAVVNRISMAVNSTLDLDAVLHTAVREMAQAFGIRQAGIMLLDPGAEYGRIAAEFQETADTTGATVRIPLNDNPSLTKVISSQQPLAIFDARQDPLTAAIRDVVEKRNIQSILIVPLIVKGRVIGTLGLDVLETPRVFSPVEIDLAGTMANQVAIAIENARLFQEVSHHLEEVQVLSKVARAATSLQDFDEVIRRGVVSLLGLRNFERVNILLIDEEQGSLWLHPVLADSDRFPQRASSRVLLGQGITGSVAETGQPLRVADVREEPRYVAGYTDTLSELCVPLRAGIRTIGVLDVQSTQLAAFSASDERLLTTVGNQLSTVIENSRLFAEAQQRVAELTSLMEVSQALNEAQDLDTTLDIVLEKVFSLLDSTEGSIILIDPPSSDRLRIVAERGLGPKTLEAFNSRPVYKHEGTYKRTLATGKIIEVSDTSSDPDFLSDVGSRAKQVTNVPLMTEQGPIGLIAVDGLPQTETTRRLLATLAGIAAVAIDKERLHQETGARLAEVSTLYTLSTQITSSLSLASVLNSIVSILRMTLDCRACSIFLIDSTEDFLQLEAASGPSVAWKGIARLRVGEGISGRVIAEQRLIYIPDTRLEPDFIFFDPQIRSLLVVPLKIRDKAVGTLSIDDSRPNAFDEEIRLLTIAAAQASVAFENAQLYESLQESYQELEHAFDELRQLDKMKSELIQNISHELRTPLTFIKGYIELLQDGEMGELASSQQKAMTIVADKTEALSRLVDDIISMLQVGREQLQTTLVSLPDIGRIAVQAAHVSVMGAGLTLRAEIPDQLPPVMGDRRRLGQVLDNLIQNAVKFSKPKGTITVHMEEAGSEIRTQVHDVGIGIPAEQLSRIFDRFYQVDGTTTRRFGGTGLGLAIVKQIVEAHGGQVGVESKEGEGSLFYFTIPKADTEQP